MEIFLGGGILFVVKNVSIRTNLKTLSRRRTPDVAFKLSLA